MMVQHDDAVIASVRQFNRFYTQQIGMLEQRLWNSPYSLVQARVLYEIAMCASPTASEIGSLLDMDAGHLSRTIRQLESAGLISRKRRTDDGRRFDLKLTALGRRALKAIDRASQQSTQNMLANVPPVQCQALINAMQGIQQRLQPTGHSPSSKILLRDRQPGDLGWAIERHGTLYAQSYGWNRDFDTLVAGLFADFAKQHDETRERMWIAELDGVRVGCAFVVKNKEDAQAAQLRCLLVDPQARGHGVGRCLLDAAIAFARGAHYQRMVLWTNDILVAARHLYESAGFSLQEEAPHHSFGQNLMGQIWMKPL